MTELGKGSSQENPELKKAVDIIVQKLNPQKIILFGSRARGTNRPDSDYDIFVVLDEKNPKARGVRSDLLRNKCFIPIDFIFASLSELNSDSKVLENIKKEGVTLYERP